jgi:hypothetical protein
MDIKLDTVIKACEWKDESITQKLEGALSPSQSEFWEKNMKCLSWELEEDCPNIIADPLRLYFFLHNTYHYGFKYDLWDYSVLLDEDLQECIDNYFFGRNLACLPAE